MRQSTEEVIARHRAWLAKQGVPIKPRGETTAAPAPAAGAATKPELVPLPATPKPPPRPRPPPVQPQRHAEHLSPLEREWKFLCQRDGTPIYDQAVRLLQARSLT